MGDKNESGADRHLDTPSESNSEKHIHLEEVEEEGSENFVIDKNSTGPQKQRNKGIKDGERQKTGNNTTAIPMDEDDTLGVP